MRSSSPMLSKILLGLLILFLVEERSALEATPLYEDCAPQTCGKHLVQYPFSLKEQNQSCGPPPFTLSCANSSGNLILTFFRFSFNVVNIFYNNNSIQLTFGDYDPCILLLTNTVIDVYPFALSSFNRQIFFLYNCSIEEADDLRDYENLTCSRFNSLGFYGGEFIPGHTNLSDRNCNFTIMPVMNYSNLVTSSDYRPLLRTGWLSTWIAPDCSACNNSGGRCGYDSSMAKFICICHDGINSDRCGGKYVPV